MNRRNLPLSQLRAFEAAGRLGSFKAAALELGLTQSAVSHHIRSLEKIIGARLFLRNGKTIALTPEGMIVLEASSGALDSLSEAISNAKKLTSGSAAAYQINLAVAPSFATRWLLPRIQKFQRHFPNVQVNITAAMSASHGEQADFDAAIIYDRDIKLDDDRRTLLFREMALPVCAPSLLPNKKTKLSLDDIERFNVILNSPDPWDWIYWASEVHIDSAKLHSRIVFDNDDLAIQSALAARGLALPELRFIEDDIYARRLVAPFDVAPVPLGAYYFLKYSHRRYLDELQNWLCTEAGSFKFQAIEQHL
jgi:LysR family glycine cleavage system transcriptional activator